MGNYTVVKVLNEAHEDGIWTVGWSKRLNRLVTGSVDDTVKVWNGESLSKLETLEGHQLGVVSVDVSPSGQYALSNSLDSQIRIWDLVGGYSLFRTIDAGPVEAWTAAFSPDGRQIAAGTHAGTVNVWSVETGEKEKPLDTRGKFVMSVAYSPNGMYLACGAENGSIHIFDVPTGKLLHSLPGHSLAVRSLTFSPDSSILVTASDDKRINLYDVYVESPSPFGVHLHWHFLFALCLYVMALQITVGIVLTTGKISHHASCLATISGHQSWVLSVAFSPDTNHFATGSSDRKVKIWDINVRQCVHTFDSHSDQVWGVAYNDDGTRLVSVSDDRSIILYGV